MRTIKEIFVLLYLFLLLLVIWLSVENIKYVLSTTNCVLHQENDHTHVVFNLFL